MPLRGSQGSLVATLDGIFGLIGIVVRPGRAATAADSAAAADADAAAQTYPSTSKIIPNYHDIFDDLTDMFSFDSVGLF